MNIEKVYFETEDKVNLWGILHTPEANTNEVIISIHGMGSNCMKRRENIFAKHTVESRKSVFWF